MVDDLPREFAYKLLFQALDLLLSQIREEKGLVFDADVQVSSLQFVC